MPKRLKNDIDGEWLISNFGDGLDFVNLATAEALAQVPLSTREVANKALEAAHASIDQ